MDAGTMRDFIRTWIDVDEEDLPDTLLNALLDEGAQRIADASPRWPWLRQSWSVTFGAGTAESGALVADPAPNELTVVRMTIEPYYTIDYLDHDYALRAYWIDSNPPTSWSVSSDRLYLWPTPTTETTVTVDGWRDMNTEWASGQPSGSEPDCPTPFHSLIRAYGLRGAFLHQDDPENASVWAQEFESGLSQKLASELRTPSAPPLVLNGAKSTIPSRPPSVWRID